MWLDELADLLDAHRWGPSPRFHGQEHGLTCHGAARLLRFARRLEPDLRPAPNGERLHPHGWRASCRLPDGRRIRVDFDKVEDADGPRILIVTAYEVR